MNNRKPLSKWQNILLYACISGGILFLYQGIMLAIRGPKPLEGHLGTLNFVFTTGILCFAMIKGTNRYRDDMLDGVMTYSKSYGHHFWICFLGSILSSLPNWIYNSFINDKYVREAFEQALNGVSSTLDADMTARFQAMSDNIFLTPWFSFLSLTISAAFTALIISILTSLFSKTADNNN